MQKLIILITLMIGINSFAQNPKEKPPIPAIHVNSLDLKITIKFGKEHFSFIEKSKILNNREYLIMNRTKTEKRPNLYKYKKNNEGNDIPNYGFKGINTNIYIYI